MKKLLIPLLLILSFAAKAQVNSITPQWGAGSVPDSLRFTYSGNTHGFQWIYNTAWIRAHYGSSGSFIINSSTLQPGAKFHIDYGILDSALLIGTTTKSNWGSGFRVIQGPGGEAIRFHAGGHDMAFTSNAYSSGGAITDWKYFASGARASLFYIDNSGGHHFYTAPAGTANAAITWNEQFSLTGSQTIFMPSLRDTSAAGDSAIYWKHGELIRGPASGGATSHSISAGNGLTGSSFNGSVALTWKADTTVLATKTFSNGKYATTNNPVFTGTITSNGAPIITNKNILLTSDTQTIGVVDSTNNHLFTAQVFDGFEVHNNIGGAGSTDEYTKYALNLISFVNYSSGHTQTIAPATSISADANLVLPDHSGTIALLSDITGGSGTMTSITPGIAFTSHTPITTSGTMNVDTTLMATRAYALAHGGSSYSAGYGLNLTGTTFKVDTSKIATLVALKDTLTANLSNAGYGLSLVSNTLKVDTTAIQTIANFFPKGDTRYLKISAAAAGANPSASAGVTAVNGSATTFMRSDAAPKIDTSVIRTVANSKSLAQLATSFALKQNIVTTTLGDIIYGGSSGTPTRLAGYTPGAIAVLTETGTGSASAAPVWTVSTGTGNVVFSANPTFTGSPNVSSSGFAASTANSFYINNASASTSGTPAQWSGAFLTGGTAWNTSSLNSKAVQFRWYTKPVSGNPVSGLWQLDGSVDGTTFINALNINTNGTINAQGPLNLKGYTVSGLPTGVTGMTAYVTDATTPTSLATVVGGGSTVVPVFYNGSNWIVQ